jgi:hypothetical protein
MIIYVYNGILCHERTIWDNKNSQLGHGSCKREGRERIITNIFMEDGGDQQMMKSNSEKREVDRDKWRGKPCFQPCPKGIGSRDAGRGEG